MPAPKQKKILPTAKVKSKESSVSIDKIGVLKKELQGLSEKLEIETALEKVRTQAMAMRKPEDLTNVCEVLYKQLLHLGFMHMRNAMINIHNEAQATFVNYDYSNEIGLSINHLSYNIHPVIEKQIKQIRKTKDAFSETVFAGDDLKDWKKFRKMIGEKDDPRVAKTKSLYYYFYSIGVGSIGISTFKPVEGEQLKVLKRFGNVFNLSYQRYTDIALAEAQAREAQIELSLERVRARTMAMQKSEELSETAAVVFQEFKKLGKDDLLQVTIGTYREAEKLIEFRVTSWAGGGEQINKPFMLSMDEPTLIKPIIRGWKSKKKSLVVDLTGKALQGWIKYRNKMTGVRVRSKDTEGRRVITVAYFAKGHLSISSPKPLPAETVKTLERFATVFDGTYTRFLDLQKAETQAREAQIGLAVERVRAKALAMYKSEEISKTVNTLRHELVGLNIPGVGAATICLKQDNGKIRLWDITSIVDSNNAFHFNLDFVFDLDETEPHDWIRRVFDPQEKYFVFEQDDAETILRTIAWVRKYNPDFAAEAERILTENNITQVWHPVASLEYGKLSLDLLQPPVADIESILTKMGAAFDLAYTRFLDLQKAEAQAREAEIQLALERVRARTMAMQKHDDLLGVLDLLVEQLVKLGVQLEVANFSNGLPHGDWDLWLHAVIDGSIFSTYVHFPRIDHPYFSRIDKSLKIFQEDGVDLFKEVFSKEEKTSWQRYVYTQTIYKDLVPDEIKQVVYDKPGYSWTVILLKETWFAIARYNTTPFTDQEDALFRRFASTFELAYTRFLDLQKAEAQAREAKIEAALERVRSKAMAMQNSHDLNALISHLFEESTRLDLILDRCLVMLVDPKTLNTTWVLSNPETPKEPSNHLVQYHEHRPYLAYLDAWEKRTEKWQYILEGDEKRKWDQFLFYQTELSQLPGPAKEGMQAISSIRLNCSFSNFGSITLSSYEPLTEPQSDILARFTKVFDLTYTRFNDLKQAEAQTREAKIEAALERVRSRSLAMHKSDELRDVVKVVFEKLQELKFAIDGAAFIGTFIEGSQDFNVWIGDDHAEYPNHFRVPYFETPSVKDFLTTKESGLDFLSKTYSQKEKNHWFKYAFEHTDLKNLPDQLKHWILEQEYLTQSFASAKNSMVGIHFHYQKNLSESEIDILKRFAKVFEQGYVRFLDLQKAEAQAREAQIQLALERVRARAMGMHSSEELTEVLSVLFAQFDVLGINPSHAILSLINIEDNTFTFRMTGKAGRRVIAQQVVRLDEMEIWREVTETWQRSEPNTIMCNDYPPEALPMVWELVSEVIAAIPEDARVHPEDFPNGMYETSGYCQFGYIGFCHTRKATDEEKDIVIRFATEFGRVYQRFLDLQKAEAQAREVQIQLSLERVRARAMTMHQSDELSEVLSVLFEQYNILGISPVYTFLSLIDLEKNVVTYRQTGKGGSKVLTEFQFTLDQVADWGQEEAVEQIKKGNFEMVSCNHLPPEALPSVWKVFGPIYDALPQDSKVYPEDFPEGIYTVQAFCQFGYIGYDHNRPWTDEEKKIVQRFAVEFATLYQRFLDLQKAEAQAREAQIEAALEKVRSTSLAIHQSDELEKVVVVLFDKLKDLGVPFDSAFIYLFDKSKRNIVAWVASKLLQAPIPVNMPYDEEIVNNPIIADLWYAIESGEHGLNKLYKEKDKDDYYRYEAKHNKLIIPDSITDFHLQAESWTTSFATEKNSIVGFDSWQGQLTNNEDFQLLKRFAKVFEQAYIRFLDLQKAEAQAREAQIETALEKVRSRSLAMHKSDELQEVVTTVFERLKELNFELDSANIAVFKEGSRDFEYWIASPSQNLSKGYHMPYVDLSLTKDLLFAWENGKDFHAKIYSFEEKNVWFTYGFKKTDFKYLPYDRKQFILDSEAITLSIALTKNTGVQINRYSRKMLSEKEIEILKRFSRVFEQAYTRFLDLQKAEAQAREAIKQASLDRVRGEIASMRSTEDLNLITPLVWKELLAMEVPFIRCGVFIVDESTHMIRAFLSAPDGRSLGVLNLPENSSDLTIQIMDHWHQQKMYITHWNREQFLQNMQTIISLGQIQEATEYQGAASPPESLHLHFVYFNQGMLYVGNVERLSAESIESAQALADSFAIAFARYEDFKQLEAAKKSVDMTLTELRATQSQLIQSEKMASLGELTAGIAHEIQNPLNFVNNFSEVSAELMKEMVEEVDKGNTEEVKALANDLVQNLEKINHHGQRASAIVKGMLQHSRSSSGVKEPTDINALCDEYLRLSYHGLRAKDKSFNAAFKTDFDSSLGKVNVISQDIGRVVLNLLTNAFYVVNEKKQMNISGYEPTVTVSTKKINDKIEIRVSDNGNGIPAKVLDKIFQPFFTTKPTGQGTGLGLSLSYDIVKAHGGELKVETKEGEGSTFIITIPR